MTSLSKLCSIFLLFPLLDDCNLHCSILPDSSFELATRMTIFIVDATVMPRRILDARIEAAGRVFVELRSAIVC